MTGGHPQSQKRAAEMAPVPHSYKYYIPKDHQNDWDYRMNMYDVEEGVVSMMEGHCNAGTVRLGHLVKTDQPYGWRVLIRQKGEFYRAQLVTIEQFHNASMAVELEIMEMLFDCREFRPKNKWIRMESEHHCTGLSMFLIMAGRHCKSVERALCSLDKRITKEIESLKPRW
ncbi:hypothetical protein BFW01_g10830 [Lasiodiplodia theobromae]|uniref:Uncharacterized protein n=1 Tax=Lasiodiplodia theobromae TaxID=45133 RepID=A0A8H7IQU2_9PEZI|nr:hypothetical protein BFW01_g10830 [Lasiodiplodia theobromae]